MSTDAGHGAPSSTRTSAHSGTRPSHTTAGAAHRLDIAAWTARDGFPSWSASAAFDQEMMNARSRSCGAPRPRVRTRKHTLACPPRQRSRRTGGTHRVQDRSLALDSQRVHAGRRSRKSRSACVHSSASPRAPAVFPVLCVLHGTPPMSPSTAWSPEDSTRSIAPWSCAPGKCAPNIARRPSSDSTANSHRSEGIARWSPKSSRPAPAKIDP
jgi:hypothetical protein